MALNPVILFKYGGNAMTNDLLKKEVLANIVSLKKKGFDIIISHGGGPFIKKILQEVDLHSEFIDGLRVTTPEAFEYIEMALKGKVNSNLVATINGIGGKAVGLSGKDGETVLATKRNHKSLANGKEVDLGQVGDVDKVNPELLKLLLQNDYIPVISCIAADKKGIGYNINGDTFAGSIAGALQVEEFVVLTDVDGLLKDKDDPSSIIREITLAEVIQLKLDGTIQGGMIPKMDACEFAIKSGAKSAKIINGTKPSQILEVNNKTTGTLIKKA